jgi:hypothetical protein
VGIGIGILLLVGMVVGLATAPRSHLTAVESSAVVDNAAPSTTFAPSVNQGAANQGAALGETSAKALTATPGGGGSSGGAAVATDSVPAQTAPAPAATGTGSGISTGQPKIVKNATISVQVKKGAFREAFDRAANVAGGHGGFVLSSDSSTEKDRTSVGTLTLRIPADAFDAVRAELAKLGTVKDEHLTGQDVGGQLVDLDARIRSLQLQEEAIRTLMAKARTIGETIDIQNQLTQVRQQIEQLSGDKARLADAAALATIRVQLAEPGAAVDTAPKPKHEVSPVRRSLTLAARGAETVLAGTIIVVGWAVPLALLALAVWFVWRLANRRKPAVL